LEVNVSPYEKVASAVAFVALLGLIASLWLLRQQLKTLIDQTRHVRKSVDVAAEAAIDTLFTTITQAYLAHPELRPIFDERETTTALPAELSDETRFRASALAEALCDSMERGILLEDRKISMGVAPLRPWIFDSFRYSRFFRDWLHARREWYTDNLLDILSKVEDELTIVSVQPFDVAAERQ
jgi:hypothetical protein